VSAFAYSREEDTAAFDMAQVPTKTISKRLSMIEKIIKNEIDASFKAQLGKRVVASLEGQSSEGEMFFGAKMDIWDKDIDGEILINESELEELEVGGRYLCEITDIAPEKLIARVLKRA